MHVENNLFSLHINPYFLRLSFPGNVIEDDVSSPEVMMAFYKRLYPFKSIFNWLNHEHVPGKLFTNREFAFTLQGDIYLRYNSFANVEDFKRQTIRLNPSRFEIGAVYNARVSHRAGSWFVV